MDQRSPKRRVTRDAGRLKNQDPSPMRVTIKAATATDAPSSRADNATTGRMAPCPIPKSRVGPKAATAMPRRLKVWRSFGEVIRFILWLPPSAAGCSVTQRTRPGSAARLSWAGWAGLAQRGGAQRGRGSAGPGLEAGHGAEQVHDFHRGTDGRAHHS